MTSLAIGTRLGPYEILAPIGAGGMGEVYRARDPRLGRDVAIKVSAERFSERFEREARAVAALNHPNICTLHDVGPNYLVMEYIEGESPKGPMPLDETLRIARQIAEALEAAHEKGIVHRDLKPANIKIKPDGTVKVLDFGLAKVAPASAGDAENSPTLRMSATQAGMILGTAAYMSPEQARGKPVDKRADIWSFGVVLYEMLTGEQLFKGDTITDILASVVREEPDWNLVPARVRPLLRRCLEKDPKKRLRDISGVELLLEQAPPEGSRGDRRWPWAVATALLALGGGLLAFVHSRETPPAPEQVRFQVLPPPRQSLSDFPVISPDGRKIVFITRDTENGAKLWVRPLDSLEAKLLVDASPEDVALPFWSPDSRFVGYYALRNECAACSLDRKLKKIEAAGGQAQTLCDVGGLFGGGTWNREGVIVFSGFTANFEGGLWKVSDAGGAPSRVTARDLFGDQMFHGSPAFLPDGRHFLYSRFLTSGTNGIYVGSLDLPPEKQNTERLLTADSQAEYVASPDGNRGYLLFLRESTLFAQPFESRKPALSGEAFPVAAAVARQPFRLNEAGGTRGYFSASASGALVYRSGGSNDQQLTWLDRQGKTLGSVGEPGVYSEIGLSPDGKRVAAVRNGDIWIIDLERNVTTRFTLDAADNRAPVWSRDGSRIAFESNRNGRGNLFTKPASGASEPETLFQSVEEKTPNSWSRDGQSLLFTSIGAKTGADVWTLFPNGERHARPFIQTEFMEGQAMISPDGRWVAYSSGEGGPGLIQICVRPFPEGDRKWVVSDGIGVEARWRGDSRELYYRTSDQRFMAVEVNASATFEPGRPRVLFRAPVVGAGAINRNPAWTVTPDGKRFLAAITRASSLADTITVVLNWQSGLKK